MPDKQIWNSRFGQDWKDHAFSTPDARKEHGLDDIVVIRRLVIRPHCCGIGIGRIVLRHAIRTIQEFDLINPPSSQGNMGMRRARIRVAGTVIPVKLTDAIRLCEHEGGLRVHEFKDDLPEGETCAFIF